MSPSHCYQYLNDVQMMTAEVKPAGCQFNVHTHHRYKLDAQLDQPTANFKLCLPVLRRCAAVIVVWSDFSKTCLE